MIDTNAATPPKRTWKILFTLRSPIQIGEGSVGMVEKTRLYVPNRVIWGAMTNGIVWAMERGDTEAYRVVGAALGENGRDFGCCFPSDDDGVNVWRPRYDTNSGALCWYAEAETRSDDEMRARYTFSITSIDYSPYREKPSEKLHATDLISPQRRIHMTGSEPRRTASLSFSGYVKLPEAIEIDHQSFQLTAKSIAQILSRVRLGGGRKRGWGIITCDENAVQPVQDCDLCCERFEGNNWLLVPDFQIKAGDEVIAGRTHLASYRQYDAKKGPGRSFSATAHRCWDIGTLLKPGTARAASS